MVSGTVFIDRFDRFYIDLTEWRRNTESKLAEIKGASIKYASFVAMAFTAVTLIMQFWHSWRG